MKSNRLWLTTLAAFALLSCGAAYAVPNPPSLPNAGALSAVDRFLEDWRMRRQDDGLALCSPALKRRAGEAYLRMFFSGLSNPHHAAYEVSFGRPLKHNMVRFNVRLYETYTGHDERTLPQKAEIVAVKGFDGKWSIDRLP